MKKKISLFLMCCLMVVCPLLLSGCGEQFIIEQEYKLLGMQVIVDNTSDYGFDSGEFVTYFYGDITINQCRVDVGKKRTTLVWSNGEFTAKYYFDIVSGSDEYPTFSYSEYEAYKGDTSIGALSNEDKTTYASILSDIVEFNGRLRMAKSSLQLITQKNSFACYYTMVDTTNSTVVFMGQVYGFVA